MHAIAERYYLPKEIRAMAEALQYARHLLPARMRAPFVIDLREFTGCIRVFNKVDLVLHFLFHHGFASFVIFMARCCCAADSLTGIAQSQEFQKSSFCCWIYMVCPPIFLRASLHCVPASQNRACWEQ